MDNRNKIIFFLLTVFAVNISFAQKPKAIVNIVTEPNASNRVEYGINRLKEALSAINFTVNITHNDSTETKGRSILVVEKQFASSQNNRKLLVKKIPKEGFEITTPRNNLIVVEGGSSSGALYGCLALIDSIKASGKLPAKINVTDSPQMVMRGTCIGVQKSDYLPGRDVYEYPYTPESFPWFYDKQLWIQYLDSLVENRMNALYLWNGD